MSDLFALPFDELLPVFKSGGHIVRIGKDRSCPTVRRFVFKPNNSYDIVQSETLLDSSKNDGQNDLICIRKHLLVY